jgi:hypothetical protein
MKAKKFTIFQSQFLHRVRKVTKLRNSIEQVPSWESSSRLTAQNIPPF